MTNEQKAKAYDEALEKAKFYYNNCPLKPEKKQLEAIFPELAESEDERIRRWIIEELGITRDAMNGKNPYSDDPNIVARLKRLDEAIAYLEKQKDEEPIMDSIKFEEGFKTGRESGLRDGQKYVLDNAESYGLYKPAEWSEEDKKKILELKTFIAQCNGFRKANRQKAFNMIDALYPQPKRDWSEENRKDIADFLYGLNVGFTQAAAKERAKDILSIIRSQPHWKPTEEQMLNLKCIVSGCSYDFKPLESLYDDLKKLM